MIKVSKFIHIKRLFKFWFKIFWRDTITHRIEAKKILKNSINKNISYIWVTWTNWKSSTVYFLYQILNSVWEKCGFWSTTLVNYGDWVKDNITSFTMPPKKTLKDFILKNIENGSKYIILECSSQWLNQFRHSEINFFASWITNITPEHLDYHKNMEIYLHAKGKIFSNLYKKIWISVLNKDDESFEYLYWISISKKCRIISYSLQDKNAEIFFNFADSNINILWTNYKINLNRYPDFQINNILLAMGIALWIWITQDKILNIIGDLQEPPWRFEVFRLEQSNIECIVDYAHTPDWYEKLFSSLKWKYWDKNIYVIFWWDIWRQDSKWLELGKIVSQYAKYSIITHTSLCGNNELERMFTYIKQGFWDCTEFEIIKDRRDAIKSILKIIKDNSLIVFLWVWHEKFINIWTEKIDWNEKEFIVNEWRAIINK